MNIQQMQYFTEVCRYQNVTRAAEMLHMSQSTLSQAMKNLEKETGLNLFRHVGRNIRITEDGYALLQETETILRHIKRFEAGIKEIAHRHNHLQIALPPQIATVILPLLLGEFHSLHPEIQLEIIEPSGTEAVEMVEREEVDLAFVHDVDSSPSISLRRLSAWPICFCVSESHELAVRESVDLTDTVKYPLALLGRNFILTRKLLELYRERKLQPEILYYSPHLSTIWNIVKQGIACSILTGNGIPSDSGMV